MTGNRVKGGMWCPAHGPVAAVRNTHGARNAAGVAAAPSTLGLSLLFTRVEPWICPQCGSAVRRAPAVAPTQLGDGPCTVTLVAAGRQKTIAAIKAVRTEMGWGLKEAKAAVDGAPHSFAGLSEEKAERLRAAFEQAGSTVELHRQEPEADEDTSTSAEVSPQPDGPVAVDYPETLAGELERLARLHAGGALTDQEYASAKRQLLET